MEEFVQSFFKALNPKLSAYLGGAMLFLVVVPYLFRIWEAMTDFRSERRKLEIMKLRYEIESLKKQCGDLDALATGSAPKRTEGARVDGSRHSVESSFLSTGRIKQWRWLVWLSTHQPLLARLLLVVLTILHYAAAIFFGVAGIEGAIEIITSKQDRNSETVAIFLFCGMMFLYAVILIWKLTRQRRLLTRPKDAS
jgi:hypothetical protein